MPGVGWGLDTLSKFWNWEIALPAEVLAKAREIARPDDRSDGGD